MMGATVQMTDINGTEVIIFLDHIASVSTYKGKIVLEMSATRWFFALSEVKRANRFLLTIYHSIQIIIPKKGKKK